MLSPVLSRPRLTVALIMFALAFQLLPGTSVTVHAATFIVTTSADAGAGSLRQAITDANTAAGDDTITFAAATNGTPILLASALPDIINNGALTITGNGAANTIVNGNNITRGFSVAAGATTTISGVTITGGNVGNGGGINNAGNLTVISSIITNNTANNGGGIYNTTGSTLTLTNSSVSINTAIVGGGIFAFTATLTVNNSTIIRNTAATAGNIYNSNATTTLNNSIIADRVSGGVDCFNIASTVTVQKTLIVDASCGITNGVNGNLTGDPALNPDLTLSAASTAIDAGLNGLVPGGITTDVAGNPRIQGGQVDMGAFESGITAPTATPTSTPTPTATPGGPTATPGGPTATPTVTPVVPTATPKPRKPTATPTPPGRITGTIINLTTGAPVPGIAVQVGNAVVTSDSNGNYDRNGLDPGDYEVQLLLTADQGEPAQDLIVITLPPGATIVQHLALRMPVAAPAIEPTPVAPGTDQAANPDGSAGSAATPIPADSAVPAQLPRTGESGGQPWNLILVGLALLSIGWRLARRNKVTSDRHL